LHESMALWAAAGPSSGGAEVKWKADPVNASDPTRITRNRQPPSWESRVLRQ
jgi:hypothetical protein